MARQHNAIMTLTYPIVLQKSIRKVYWKNRNWGNLSCPYENFSDSLGAEIWKGMVAGGIKGHRTIESSPDRLTDEAEKQNNEILLLECFASIAKDLSENIETPTTAMFDAAIARAVKDQSSIVLRRRRNPRKKRPTAKKLTTTKLRKRKPVTEYLEVHPDVEPEDPGEPVEVRAIRAERIAAVRAALPSISNPEHRNILKLRFFDEPGCTVAETARRLQKGHHYVDRRLKEIGEILRPRLLHAW